MCNLTFPQLKVTDDSSAENCIIFINFSCEKRVFVHQIRDELGDHLKVS